MKKLRTWLQVLGIMFIGCAAIIWSMSKSNNADHQRVLDGLSALKSIVEKQPGELPEREAKHFEEKCKEAVENGETLHPEKQKFCEYVLNGKGAK